MTTRRKYMLEFPCLFFPCFSSHCRGASEGRSTWSGRGALAFVRARVLLGWCPVTLTAVTAHSLCRHWVVTGEKATVSRPGQSSFVNWSKFLLLCLFPAHPPDAFPIPGAQLALEESWSFGNGRVLLTSCYPALLFFIFCIKILSVEFNSQIAV